MSSFDIRNGTAIDAAISHFHDPQRFPKVHLPYKLEQQFNAYCRDEFSETVDVLSIQASKSFRYKCRTYKCRIDQIRDGKLWDVKYSKMGPSRCLRYYLPQLIVSAYAFGVEIGGIINVKNYETPNPVYYAIDSVTPVEELMAILHTLLGRCKIEDLQ